MVNISTLSNTADAIIIGILIKKASVDNKKENIKTFKDKSSAQRFEYMKEEDSKNEKWAKKNLNQFARDDFSKKNFMQMIKDKDWR